MPASIALATDGMRPSPTREDDEHVRAVGHELVDIRRLLGHGPSRVDRECRSAPPSATAFLIAGSSNVAVRPSDSLSHDMPTTHDGTAEARP